MNRLAAIPPRDGCAWVTGASSGIGRAVALALAQQGWRVAVSARGAAELASLESEAAGLTGSIHSYPLDVSDPERAAQICEAIWRDLGPIALGIFNAGVYLPVELTAGAFDRQPFATSMQVNYLGVVNCLAPVASRQMARGSGHLVIVSSVTGYGGLPRAAAYGPTKAALINLAECLKFDLDKAGVRISIVCPGFVDTPATAGNPFPMPFLMPAGLAAQRILAGIHRQDFEITFPRRFTFMLKFLNLLPYALYFPLVKRITGWR